ncbi:DUF6737 family protein [Oscillatoria sp. FACHB-1406]|uniref:DUF6737 family protein n=1 Tax=Oscillatoria sp. FACHB-1406 TaxID=2692846 RepID=UPI001684F2B0|nr:DUF6737 family protein [Oscillatoria sp. FACHB-1406]MBD2580554.1 hypothetical protein [Oscillatoria sp. FACHB-1406]
MSTEPPVPAFNVWNYKPWWCQPWSILLTGSVAIAASWFLTQRVWVALPVAVAIALWWGYFLLLWPKAVARSLAAGAFAEPPAEPD